MAALAVAIPAGVFVLSLRADSSDLELTIVGSDVGTIPDQIARLTPFVNVEVIGSITHELVDGRQMQRVALRCRTADSPPVIPARKSATRSIVARSEEP